MNASAIAAARNGDAESLEIILRDLEGLSGAEVSAALGIDEPATPRPHHASAAPDPRRRRKRTDRLMLGDRPLLRHLLQGGLGLASLVLAFVLVGHATAWSVLPAVVGLALLRGCPTCWAIGLVELLGRRSTAKVCSEDGCSLPQRSVRLTRDSLG
jgi:hypothetical protein